MKKLKFIFLIILMSLFAQVLHAQLNYSTSFDGCLGNSCSSGGVTWTLTESSFTSTYACNTNAARDNLWSSDTSEELTSSLIGQSNGTAVTFSFEAKAIDYSTQAAIGLGDCTFTGYWSTDGSTWTSLNTIDCLASATCNTYTFDSFTPACGDDVYVRIEAEWVVGDFYVIIDDVSVVQNPDGPTGSVVKTCIGDYSTYDLDVTVSDLDGSTGVDIKIGATTHYSNIGLGTYTISGLSGAVTVDVVDVSDPCRGFSETFSDCDICSEASSLPEDECIDAPIIDLSEPFNGSTSCSYTVSAGSPNVCGQSVDNDSWMRFIAADTEIELDYTIGDCANDDGIQLAVFSGSCGSLTNITGSCVSPSGELTTATWNFTGLTIGATYYVRIDGYAGDLCDYYFEPVAGVVITPDNDECADAMLLNCGDSDIASNILATDTDAPTACTGGGTAGKGVWYEFTGTGQEVTVSTDNAGTNFDTQINVFSGTCGSLVCEGGDDDSGTGTTSSMTFVAANGTDYYIYVDGDGAAEGQFEISLTCVDACNANPGTWQY